MTEADEINAIAEAAEKLVAAITYDDIGSAGVGGNGGLLSRETIRATDELRIVLLRYRAKQMRRTDA